MSQVKKLYLSTGDKTNPRENVQSIDVDNKGVKNDKFYNTDPNRAILIASCKSYDIARNNSIAMQEGDLGENILVDFNMDMFEVGQQIKIGSVILEVTQLCTLCKGLSSIDSKLPKLLKADRGIFFKAISNGTINIKDKLTII